VTRSVRPSHKQITARRSQHSQECKDQCPQCFRDSWPRPLTFWPQNKRISRTHLGTLLCQSLVILAAIGFIFEIAQGCFKDQFRTTQGLIGSHDQRGARAYNGDLEAEPPTDVQGRVVHRLIFCDPIQPNPSADWHNPTQPKVTVNIRFETCAGSKMSLSNSTQQVITNVGVYHLEVRIIMI